MKEFYIFQYTDLSSFEYPTSVTVIFAHQKHFDNQQALSDEIKEFFQTHNLSEKLVVLLPKYASAEFIKYFTEGKDETFKRVPGRSPEYFASNYFLYTFDVFGKIEALEHNILADDFNFTKSMLRNGSTQIFVNRGGLVESSSDHHFVFPSNKHCPKFIRTGNILINSTEIFFIAIQLLTAFEGKSHIYCDTSSINVLPFSVFELKRRFDVDFNCPVINSFESYAIFEAKRSPFSRDSLVLISSSTSGNIIDRLLKNGIANREQIKLLFYLGAPEKYRPHSTNIMCNLTKDDYFKEGVDPFDTYDNENECKLCKEHSRPIQIQSDVFLTIQPKIKQILLVVGHAPTFLNNFVSHYRGKTEGNVLFKTYYKEQDAVNNYEVFIDTKKLFEEIQKGEFPKYAHNLQQSINTNIPANTKYLVHLPDSGSLSLAKNILGQIQCSEAPKIIHIDNLVDEIRDQTGSVVIVASSIVTGRHLLHISRAFRKYKKLSLIYFIGILRTSNEEYCDTLKKNLSRGRDRADKRPVIAVEELHCSPEKINTSWKNEKVFFEDLASEIDEATHSELFEYIKNRQQALLKNKATGGLIDNVFLPLYNGEKLTLRKGFAFWNFSWEENEVFQSEVYFTISTILNHLENLDYKSEHSLKQSNYTRSILSPDNFHRFNDGVIQAAILRAGEPQCFSYDLDRDASIKMRTLLESIIDKYNSDHGEALLEFLLAIGLKKLRMKKEDQNSVLEYAARVDDKIISGFAVEIIKLLSK